MAYEVRVKSKAKKAIRAILQSKLRQQVRDAIDGLEKDPRPEGSEKLEGTPKGVILWRIRRGDFRIVMRFGTKNWLFSWFSSPRGGVYTMLKELK